MEDKNLVKQPEKEYTSRTKRGQCMNLDCPNSRRSGSKFCQPCSDKHKS